MGAANRTSARTAGITARKNIRTLLQSERRPIARDFECLTLGDDRGWSLALANKATAQAQCGDDQNKRNCNFLHDVPLFKPKGKHLRLRTTSAAKTQWIALRAPNRFRIPNYVSYPTLQPATAGRTSGNAAARWFFAIRPARAAIARDRSANVVIAKPIRFDGY